MNVDPTTTPHRAEGAGRAFFFCCNGCRTKFLAEPERYVGSQEAQAATPISAKPAAMYTCPMHPQIRRNGPGACPICGMALEPELGAEAGDNSELIDMTRRFWIGLAFAFPLIALGMGRDIPAISRLVDMGAANWIQLILSIPVVFWAAAPFFARAVASLRSRNLNMFTLIGLGVGASWLYSAAATLTPSLFPNGFREADGAVGVYFDAAAAIVVFVLLGQILELRARARTGEALRALLDLSPRTARRLSADGSEREAPIAEVQVGDRLRVRPGERIPVDGAIVEGRGFIDESMVTGEPMAATRNAGDKVVGGTIAQSGGFVMVAEKVGAETLLAQIVAFVAQAQRSRAPIQGLADRVAAWFVPLVLLTALVAFASWAAFGPQPRLAYGLVAAVSVLMIACPCALGLATPMSIMVGIGRAAALGLLVRDAEALERLATIDAFVLDKTGAVTQGRPKVVSIFAAAGFGQDEVLRASASLEQGSEHPLAACLVDAAKERGLALTGPTEFTAQPGQGVRGLVEGRAVVVGNRAMMAEARIDLSSLDAEAETRAGEGATLIYATLDGRAAGLIAVADPLKPTSAQAIRTLRAAGLRIVMATGDSLAAAAAIGRRAGIDEIRAELCPAEKARIVAELRGQGAKVAFVGDGVNDAPALAAADVGIAMGSGTDVAIEAAGVALLNGDLIGLARGRALSRATMRNIRQNLTLAFVYNAVGVPIAAGALYPAFGLLLSPAIAAAAMSLSSASVVLNALRLRRTRL